MYDQLWMITAPHSGNHYENFFCKSTVDAASKNLYVSTRGLVKRNPGPVILPYMDHYRGLNTINTSTQWVVTPECTVDPPVSGA